ncbi:MAG: HAMP domain-containing histidine kinase [Anaerolineae bacterium]|nr:HAMP domain-containing histidine kinase [Anaerolineae bacterium]
MRKHWPWLLAALAVPVPAVLGLAMSAMLSRAIAPEDMQSVYLQADVAALAWVCGSFFSLLLAVVFMIAIWERRRDNAWRAEIAETQAQATERASQEAAEDRRRFLRRLDHELKNPLTAIRAGLANLAEAQSQNVQQETLNSVETQILRISHLVADLRKLAELETRPLERIPVDITALLEEAVNVAKDLPETADRLITLTLPQAPWPLPHVAGDWDLLFLAVYNLLDNARKFTQAGDTLEVRAFEDGATIVIEVADTGPGIPEEDVPHVWEELYRGKGAHSIPGSGLGLALVRAIIERHGGQTSVRSRAGQGTVFTLRLPAA